ncbi:MAG: adenosine deaminase [Kiritimatiellia bacterium]|jgi:adenosine deaminase
MFTDEVLLSLPKSDLHCHLDGSLRLSTLIELAQQQKVKLPSYTEDGLRQLVFKDQYRDLPDYLHGFAYTCAVLQELEALERSAYELGKDCLAEGVCYVEVRFAPQLHLCEGRTVADVLQAVDRGLDRVGREDRLEAADPDIPRRPRFRYGIVACAMRNFSAGFSPYYRDLLRVLGPQWPMKKVHSLASLALVRDVVDARDRLGIPVVAFDLAGAEAGHPASAHHEAFDFAHKHFLRKTVHAGEAYGPESIFQAITSLHADRIGHGTHLFSVGQVRADDPVRYVRQLTEYIANRRVTLEVCITSNMQTMPELRRVEDHPLGRMIDERLSATLCTDNRLVSHTTVSKELRLAVDAFKLRPANVRNLILHGFKRSFFPGSYREKRAYVHDAIEWYDRVAADCNLPVAIRGEPI